MNNKGFTTFELAMIIGVFSLIYLAGVMSVSYAFSEDPNQIAYDEKINTIENQAEVYANLNADIFEESNIVYIYVKDLIEAEYLLPDEGNLLINPLDENKNLNDIKIKIIKDGDKISVNVVEI